MTTNDANQISPANQTSLLAHLAYKKFTAQTQALQIETIATEALGYILSFSEAARNALRDMIRTGGADIDPIARVQTEVVGKKMERIDLSAFNEAGEERVLIEVKFWAELTGNQPSEYLARLPDDDKPSVLLFVTPEIRLATFWSEILRRATEGGFVLGRSLESGSIRAVAIDGSNRRLMLTSWRALLGSMSSRASVEGESAAERDILQLNALCEREDTEAFQPLRGGELSLEFPRIQGHLTSLVWDAVASASQQGIISWHGPWASSVDSHGIWITLGGANAIFYLNYRHWEKEGETPLWLWFNKADDAIRERLQADLVAGKDILPIYLRKGVEREAVLNGIVERLREIRDILAAPAPPPTPPQTLPSSP